MRKMPLSRLFAVMIALVMSFSVTVAISQMKFAKAEAIDINAVISYYDQHKTDVENVDRGGEIFHGFYKQYEISGDESFYLRMKDEVEVSAKVNSFDDFIADDYSVNDWGRIEKIIADAKADAQIKNATFDKAKIIDKLNSASAEILKNYKTLVQKFDNLKAESIAEIEARRDEILEANIGKPNGSVEAVPYFYDTTAKADVEFIASNGIDKIGAVEFKKGSTAENSVIKNIVTKAVADMRAVSANDILRACDAINDYYAELDVTPLNQKNVDLLKEVARNACQKAKDEVISKANDSVLKAYSNEISQINIFPMEDYQPSTFEKVLKEVIATDDGAVVVRAVKLKEGKAEPYAVFPEGVHLRVLPNNLLSAVKKNVDSGVHKLNKKLSVAYCMSIDVFDGSNKWEEVNTAEDGAKVVYQVEIDLNKYYQNYVSAGGNGVFENLLSNVSFMKNKVFEKNRIEKIISADKYISGLSGDDQSSLVYSYNFAEGGARSLNALTYQLNDGGILMFETSSFGTFASSQSADNNIFANPIFWIVLALVVIALIVILIIILKNIKYKFTFITDGGSKVAPVKARKGESFPLPDPPVKEGYVFGGWFLDKEGDVRFIDTFVGKRKNVKVYAKWYESDIPEKFVKYYEALRNEILCYSKVGPLANTGLQEREILAKLFADKEGVYLYVAVASKKLSKKGYSVDNVAEEAGFEETPSKVTVTDKESFKEAVQVVKLLMGIKGLQNVGLAEQPEPMSLEERRNGFVFVIENDRVAVSISDYFDYLRVYTKRFVVYDPTNSAEEGTILTRMYLEEDCIRLYLATSPRGTLIDASDRFEDEYTPALFIVRDNMDDIQSACDYIDKIMEANGLERRNENANGMKLPRPKVGCGCAFVVTFNN